MLEIKCVLLKPTKMYPLWIKTDWMLKYAGWSSPEVDDQDTCRCVEKIVQA